MIERVFEPGSAEARAQFEEWIEFLLGVASQSIRLGDYDYAQHLLRRAATLVYEGFEVVKATGYREDSWWTPYYEYKDRIAALMQTIPRGQP